VLEGHAKVGFSDAEIKHFFDVVNVIKTLWRTHKSLDSEDAANEHDAEGVRLRFHYPGERALARASLKGSTPKKKRSAQESGKAASDDDSICVSNEEIIFDSDDNDFNIRSGKKKKMIK